METDFRPYLQIRDKEHLQSLLNKQKNFTENYYSFSKNDCFSKKDFYKEVALVKNFYGYTPKKEDEEFVNELIYHILVLSYYRQTGYAYSQIFFLCGLFDNKIIELIDFSIYTIGYLVKSYSKKPKQYFNVLTDEVVSLNYFIKKYYKDVTAITVKDGVKIIDFNLISFIDFIEFLLSTIFSIISYNEDRKIKQLFINLTFSNINPVNKITGEILNIINDNKDCFRSQGYG